MNQCPKCRSSHINGPSYTKDFLGREWLDYRCNHCGYSEKGPCADAMTEREALKILLGDKPKI